MKILGKEKLLAAILEPNAVVHPAYTAFIAETKEGEIFTGCLRDDNPATVTLWQPEGSEVVIPRGNMLSLQSRPWSIMPAGLEQPLGRYLLELEADSAEGRSWFGEPSRAELVDWEPVLSRAGVSVEPHRIAAAYLELAVLVRALEGLSATARWQSSMDRGSLWAGLFDLRENLLGRALDDLRAIAS